MCFPFFAPFFLVTLSRRVAHSHAHPLPHRHQPTDIHSEHRCSAGGPAEETPACVFCLSGFIPHSHRKPVGLVSANHERGSTPTTNKRSGLAELISPVPPSAFTSLVSLLRQRPRPPSFSYFVPISGATRPSSSVPVCGLVSANVVLSKFSDRFALPTELNALA